MEGRTTSIHRHRAAMLIALAATVVLTGARPSGADDANAAPAMTNAAPGRAASRIQIDPQTGRRVAAPTGAVALPADPAFSTSHAGLVEQPAPGGGVMVDLQGRFRSAATVTVGPDGTAQRDCVAPGTAGGKP
jgi:hypothetical protein